MKIEKRSRVKKMGDVTRTILDDGDGKGFDTLRRKRGRQGPESDPDPYIPPKPREDPAIPGGP